MCEITNEQATEILKGLREVRKEGINSINDDKLAELHANAYILLKELEEYIGTDGEIKQALIKRKVTDKYFPKIERKVLLENGKGSTEYDVKGIHDELSKADRVDDFLKIVNISKSKAEGEFEVSDDIHKFLTVFSDKVPGKLDAQIAVRKFSKKDRAKYKNGSNS